MQKLVAQPRSRSKDLCILESTETLWHCHPALDWKLQSWGVICERFDAPRPTGDATGNLSFIQRFEGFNLTDLAWFALWHDFFTLPYALRWHQIRAAGSTNLVRAAWRRWWRGAFPPGPAWNELHIRQCHVQVLTGIGWRCSPGPASFSGIHRVEVQKRCWGPAVFLNAYLVQAALRLSSLMEGTPLFCLVPMQEFMRNVGECDAWDPYEEVKITFECPISNA